MSREKILLILILTFLPPLWAQGETVESSTDVASTPFEVLFGVDQSDAQLSVLIAQSREILNQQWNTLKLKPVWSESSKSLTVQALQKEAFARGIALFVYFRLKIRQGDISIRASLYHTVDGKKVISSESGGSLDLGSAGKWGFITSKLLPAAMNYPIVYPEPQSNEVDLVVVDESDENPTFETPAAPEPSVEPQELKETPVEGEDSPSAFRPAFAFEVPLAYALNITETEGNWHGITQEGALLFFYMWELKPALQIGGYFRLGYSFDHFFLPDSVYPSGSVLMNHNLVVGTGFSLNYKGFYLNAGAGLKWFGYSNYRYLQENIQLPFDNLPLGFSAQLGAGYRLAIDNGWSFSIGGEVSVTPGVDGAVPLRFALTPRFIKSINSESSGDESR